MTSPGMCWRHVIINTLGTWLDGDRRGFRSRKHRIHSSGDYRHPPPAGEHQGLHDYHEDRARAEVTIAQALRPAMGRAILAHLLGHPYRTLAFAIGKVHAHFLVELPESLPLVKAIVGEAKRRSSRAVKDELAGNVWASGGTFKMVETEGHLRGANDYIPYDQGPLAWTWSFRDRSGEGRSGRSRADRSGPTLRSLHSLRSGPACGPNDGIGVPR